MNTEPQFWIFVCGIDYDLDVEDVDEEPDMINIPPPHILFQVTQDQVMDYFADPDEWIAEEITDGTGFLINGAMSHKYVGEVDPSIDPEDMLASLIAVCEAELDKPDFEQPDFDEPSPGPFFLS